MLHSSPDKSQFDKGTEATKENLAVEPEESKQQISQSSSFTSWKWTKQETLLYGDSGTIISDKVLVLSLDDSIIQETTNWKLIINELKLRIQEYYKKSYKIVVFVNSIQNESSPNEKDLQAAIEDFGKQVEVPIQSLISLKADSYSKPFTGMFKFFANTLNVVSKLNLKESYLVGDFIKKPEEKPTAQSLVTIDHKFAINIGLRFKKFETFCNGDDFNLASKSELQKMLDGNLYDSYESELVSMRCKSRQLFSAFNKIPYENAQEKKETLKQMLGGAGDNVEIQASVFFDYGCNTFIGNNVYLNFNCTILDCARVIIGNNVLIAPNVQIYTVYHPTLASERNKGPELAETIIIGDSVWLGGGVIICPGVSIGENTTIGAGSVVTKNIPANVVAAGNPCRIIKELPEPSR